MYANCKLPQPLQIMIMISVVIHYLLEATGILASVFSQTLSLTDRIPECVQASQDPDSYVLLRLAAPLSCCCCHCRELLLDVSAAHHAGSELTAGLSTEVGLAFIAACWTVAACSCWCRPDQPAAAASNTARASSCTCAQTVFEA